MDFDDDLEDNENIENEDQTTVTMDNNSPPKSGEDFFLTQQDFDAAHGGDAQNPNKRTRSNAKAVECLDMDGNHIKTFRSGIAAVRELGVPQGDISLCCRGLKDSISGYKFRFVVEEHRQNAALRRGYTTEPVPPAVPAVAKNSFDIPLNDEEFQGRLVTRLSRHRVDTEKDKQVKDSILAPAAMKARKWQLTRVRVGSMLLKRWVSNQEKPTEELQNFRPRKFAAFSKKRKFSGVKGGDF